MLRLTFLEFGKLAQAVFYFVQYLVPCGQRHLLEFEHTSFTLPPFPSIPRCFCSCTLLFTLAFSSLIFSSSFLKMLKVYRFLQNQGYKLLVFILRIRQTYSETNYSFWLMNTEVWNSSLLCWPELHTNILLWLKDLWT